MIEKLRTFLSRLLGIVLIIIILFSKSYWNEKFAFIGVGLCFAGIILAAAGSFGRLWCSLYIAGYKTDKLITDGPYSMCRNPLYFFSFIGAAGVGLATETFSIPLMIIIAFAAYYPFVIKSEEARLEKIYKSAFKDYIKRTPKFFPNISSLTEPQEYLTKPTIFRKHILDAIWFLWAIGALEIIEGLHELGILPTMFTIY